MTRIVKSGCPSDQLSGHGCTRARKTSDDAPKVEMSHGCNRARKTSDDARKTSDDASKVEMEQSQTGRGRGGNASTFSSC